MAEVKGGGCCIARYNAGNGFIGGGGGGGSRGSSQVDQIMLRFRPIAPKPSPNCPPDYAPPPAPARNKRRCGPGGRSRSGSRSRRKQAPAAESAQVIAPVTLPLLPEAPEPKSSPGRDSSPSSILGVGAEWAAPAVSASASASVGRAALVGWTCVTVERVGEAGGEGAWEEMRRGLESEEAGPGFVTDAWNCVRWVNDAFRKMVGGAGEEANGGGGWGGVMVSLVAKEKLPGAEVKAFTCRVRVQYTSGEKEKHSLTAPCDVWRMEGGGCTWRLDVKAALSLGR